MARQGGRPGGGIGSVLLLLVAMLATAVVAGLIGAGLFMPVVGAAGASARAGVGFFDALPAELKRSPLAQQSRILAADGSVLATFYDENRVVVPLSQVAPVMRKAQVAIEDNRFYQHGGIDPRGVLRAAVNNASSDSTQGASTLTQQYVKLTLQENAIYNNDAEAAAAATARTPARKLQEAKYAIAIEKNLSKNQILEGYLNIAYFGDGAYGVETAARHYFSTSAAKLTLPQAALLAGIVQRPGDFDPRRNPKAAVTRRNVVLARMLETGAITQAQHDQAVKTPLVLAVRPTGNGCDGSRAPFFCNYVYQQVLNNKVFGQTPQQRRQLVFRGGLTIRTTLDLAKQADAEKAISDKVAPRNRSEVAAAMSVVEPGSGRVLAMAQSRPFGRDVKQGQTVVNYNVDGAYGGGSGFPTGSTFKAFTLAAALEQGRPLTSTISAPPGGTKFYRSDFKPGSCIDLRDPVYAPFNSEGKEQGTYSLVKVTADSVNTAFVKLESEVGICAVKDVAENLGVHLGRPQTFGQPDNKPSTQLRPFMSLTLGSESIAPLTMAAAYAAFAADGTYCEPISITGVTALGGKALPVPKPSCTQAIPQGVARAVTIALTEVLKSGTAKRVPKVGRPAAGKTGTTNSSTHLWFVGYTPQLSAAVWFGHPAGDKGMFNIDTGRAFYPKQLFGATVSAPIWAAFISAASQGLPVENFGRPDDKTLYGDLVAVPSVSGEDVATARADLEGAGFTVAIGGAIASAAPAGSVAGTSPRSGTRVAAGSTVTIYTSSGPAPVPPPALPGPTVTIPAPPAPVPSPTRGRGKKG